MAKIPDGQIDPAASWAAWKRQMLVLALEDVLIGATWHQKITKDTHKALQRDVLMNLFLFFFFFSRM